ncbi:MAG: hypothetical protein IJ976_07050, partial [Alistipes sp.]|nr:hypothetical protein [Alistipes sp.]
FPANILLPSFQIPGQLLQRSLRGNGVFQFAKVVGIGFQDMDIKKSTTFRGRITERRRRWSRTNVKC